MSVAERPSGRFARARGRVRSFTPEQFRLVALVALGSLFVVVVTGAIVRLTASGLGCDNWPRCGDTPFPEKDFHALVEFGNRVVALGAMFCTLAAALVARRVAGLPRYLRVGAALVAASVFAQIPLGGLTVIFELHPLLVMSHFLLALAAVGLAVVVALGADRHARGRPEQAVLAADEARRPRARARDARGRGHGRVRHRGRPALGRRRHRPARRARRLRLRPRARDGDLRRRLPRPARRSCGASVEPSGRSCGLGIWVLGLVLAQMAIGELQWRNALPWWLVLVHVALATAVWAGVVAVAGRLLSRSRPDSAPNVTHTRVSAAARGEEGWARLEERSSLSG